MLFWSKNLLEVTKVRLVRIYCENVLSFFSLNYILFKCWFKKGNILISSEPLVRKFSLYCYYYYYHYSHKCFYSIVNSNYVIYANSVFPLGPVTSMNITKEAVYAGIRYHNFRFFVWQLCCCSLWTLSQTFVL